MVRFGGSTKKITLIIGLQFMAVWGPCCLRSASLSGAVQDRSKAPVDGARITLWVNGAGNRVETISAGGQYSFSGLEEGDYLIKVERSGMGLLFGALHMKNAERHEMNLVLVNNGTGPGLRVAAGDPSGVPKSSPLSKSSTQVKQSRVLRQVSPSTQFKTGAPFRGVNVAAVIHTDGTVDNLVVLSAGNEEVALATLLALRQWRYSPTYLEGKPVEVTTQLSKGFGGIRILCHHDRFPDPHVIQVVMQPLPAIEACDIRWPRIFINPVNRRDRPRNLTMTTSEK